MMAPREGCKSQLKDCLRQLPTRRSQMQLLLEPKDMLPCILSQWKKELAFSGFCPFSNTNIYCLIA